MEGRKVGAPFHQHNLLLVFLLFYTFSLSSSFSNAQSDGQPIGYGYTVESVSLDNSKKSLTALLQVINTSTVFDPGIAKLTLVASFGTNNSLRIRIIDSENQRWEVPQEVVSRDIQLHNDTISPDNGPAPGSAPGLTPGLAPSPPPSSAPGSVPSPAPSPPPSLAPGPATGVAPGPAPANNNTLSDPNSDLTFTLHNTIPFGFTISRQSTGDILFHASADSSNDATFLVFKDQYLQLSSALPVGRSSIYGLGEHVKKTLRIAENETMTLWNADIASLDVDLNLYRSFPFYMNVRTNGSFGKTPTGSSHGVLLLNSNGMDITYTGDRITYKVIGGILDLYIFAGPTPEMVMDQFTQLIGRPTPMPYWSFDESH